MSPLEVGLFLAIGFVGALIGAACDPRGIQLPRVYHQQEKDGTVRTFLDPGCLAVCLLGAGVAAWVDGRWYTAGFAGISVGYVGLGIVKHLVKSFLDAKGITGVTFTPPELPAPAPKHSPRSGGA
jgi:hypothetical protein